MEHKRFFCVYQLARVDEKTQYLWKHVWKTRHNDIEEQLKKHAITVVEDHMTGNPIASMKQSSENTILLVREAFNNMTVGKQAVRFRTQYTMTDTIIDVLVRYFKNDLDLAIYTDKDTGLLWIVGDKPCVENTAKNLDEKILEIHRRKNDEKDNTLVNSFIQISSPGYIDLTEEEQAKIWLYNIASCDYFKKENVTVLTIDKFKLKLSVLNCQKKDEIENEIKKTLALAKYETHNQVIGFSDISFQLLSRSKIHHFLSSEVNLLEPTIIDAVWFEDDKYSCIRMYAVEKRTLDQKSKGIKDFIREESIAVPHVYFGTESAKQQLVEVEKYFDGKVITKLNAQCNTAFLAYTYDVRINAETIIKKLYVVKCVSIGNKNVEKCRTYFQKLKPHVEKIYLVDVYEEERYGKYGWILKGETKLVQSANEELKKLHDSIVSQSKIIRTEEAKESVVEKIQYVEGKSQCVVTFRETILPASQLTSKNYIDLTPHIPCRKWIFPGESIVELYLCDLQKYSWILKNNLKISISATEEHRPSPNVNIRPVKNYMEATVYLPIWRGNSGKEKETFSNSLDILMKGIDKENTKSIAFDLSEIEKLGWPKMKYIKQILAMVQTQRPCVPIHLYEHREGQFKITTGIIEEVSLGIGHTKQAIPKCTLQVSIKKGELINEQCDVIVNSTSKDLTLDSGAISKSILRSAGYAIQQECKAKLGSRTHIEQAEVVVTDSFSLPCRKVFHGTLPLCKFDRKHLLETFVRNCLSKAVELNMKSIGFPALGTGRLGYPPEEVAFKMFDTVQKFALEQPTGTLCDVMFVIYQEDYQAIRAFETEEKRQNEKEKAHYSGSNISGPSWTETDFTCRNEDSLSLSIKVTGRDQTVVDGTFQEIIDKLSERREHTAVSVDESNQHNDQTHTVAPSAQLIDRGDVNQSTELAKHTHSDIDIPDVSKKDKTVIANKNMPLDNTFAPVDDYPQSNYTEDVQPDTCCVEIQLVDSSEKNPYEQLCRTLIEYNIKEDQIVWSDILPFKARVKVNRKEEAVQLMKCMQSEINYRTQMSNADAVVNIRAKLNESMNVYICKENNGLQLKKQSGVCIERNGGEIILTGDLTEISIARDILCRWKKDGPNFYQTEESVGEQIKIKGEQKEENAVDKQQFHESGDTFTSENRQSQDNTVPKCGQEDTIQSHNTVRAEDEPNTSNYTGHNTVQYEHAKHENHPPIESDHQNETFDKTQGAYPKNRKQPNRRPGDDSCKQTPLASNNKPKTNDQHIKKLKLAPDDSVIMTTKDGIKVFVYNADICQLGSIDCIVNSTDSLMTNQFGVSAVIAKNAGETMIHQCQRFIQKFTMLDPEKVFVSSTGKMLHYKKILHVNAPRWVEGMEKIDFTESLSKAVTICLQQANKEKMVSIALPSISSGYGNAPPDAQFTAYPKGVMDFIRKDGRKTSIKEIHFVDINEEANSYVQAAFLYAEPESHPNWKDKIRNLPKKAIEIFKPHIRSEYQAGKHLEYVYPENKLALIACDGALLKSLKHAHVKSIANTKEFGDWKYDDTGIIITEDVLMNCQSQSSRKCYERGGTTYQKNYNRLKKGKTNTVGSTVSILGDQNLEFNYVLCAFMPTFTDTILRKNSKEQTKFFNLMNSCLRDLLTEADKLKIKHLAMPVLGSDMYDIKEEWFLECCVSNMMAEVKEFALSRKRKGFMILHVVINGNEKVFQILHRDMHERQIETSL